MNNYQILTSDVDFSKIGDLIVDSYHDDGSSHVSLVGTATIDAVGLELDVDFEIYVGADVHYDSGDFLNPPFTSVDINEVKVEVIGVYIDGDEFEVADFFRNKLECVIESNI